MMSSKGKLMLVGSVNFFLLQSTLQVVSTYHSYVAFKPWHITRHKTVVVDMKKYHRYRYFALHSVFENTFRFLLGSFLFRATMEGYD